MVSDQEPLLDYTPSQAEEIARLTKLAEQRNARVEAILSDPVFQQAETNAAALDKKIKEISKIRDDLKKIAHEMCVATVPVLEEPTEDGIYIFSKKEMTHSGKIEISGRLYLKALGTWFDLKDGGDKENHTGYSWHAQTFAEFLDIDSDAIEVSITRYEGTTYPAQLLADEVEATGEGDER